MGQKSKMESEGGSSLMKFGENLYNLRKGVKMSQEKLAEEVGVSRQSVSKWENGESYPEMENMLKLCKIFHCKINDLVHGDMQDIDSLDEEIKMSAVKLEKEKQKRLKVLSKILYVLARIGKIGSRIAVCVVVVSAIIGGIILAKADIKSEKNIVFDSNSNIGVAEYIENDDGKVFVTGLNENKVMETKELDSHDADELKKVAKVVASRQKGETMAGIVIITVVAIATFILLAVALGYLEKLFKNIHEGDTPFTLENVKNIKMMTYYMIAVTILSSVLSALISFFVGTDVTLSIGTGLVTILFLYSISYIFEYGYELQKGSSGKIYDEEK